MEYSIVQASGKNYPFLQDLAYDNEIKLCIYGCGVNGELICKYLHDSGKEIEFFIDKQADIREFMVLGKKVISPRTYFEMTDDICVLVSPDNYEPIIRFLLENGIRQENILCPFKSVSKEIRILSDNYDPKEFVKNDKTDKDLTESAEPEATIFTILYNTPKGMLCRTIESVLNQSYKNFTYLIVDNGSTDGSSDIIQQYAKKDKRITYIRLDKNVVWTHKELLSKLKDNLKATYVAMVDSDDYYEPEFLEKTIEISKKDNSDLVQVNTLTYGHEGFRYNYFTHYLGKDVCVSGKDKERYFMLRIFFVPTWGKLYKTTLFQKLLDMMLSYETGYERDRNFCLDVSWSTYLAYSCNKVSLCDDILHIRTWRPGSSEHSDDHCSKWLSSLVWSFQHLRKCGTSYDDAQVFEEVALVWLFSLKRDKYNLENFREDDLSDKRVADFLSRPVCDKYKEQE